MSSTVRVLLVIALVLVAFVAVMGAVYAQGATPTATPGDAGAPATAVATPRTLPTTGGAGMATNTLTVVLLALGATAGLAGLLMRGLRRPL